MDTEREPVPSTFYELLQVHPAAPLDLITAVYWRLTGLLQTRDADKGTEVALYHLTRAYQTLADHRARAAYDEALGLSVQPLPRIPLRRRSSWMSSLRSARRGEDREADAGIDYYEVMRLDHRAHPSLVGEAYSGIRNYYLRLVEQRAAPLDLLNLLEEANAVLSDPAQRSQYDELRRKKQPATDRGGDSGEVGRSEHHAVTNARPPRSTRRSSSRAGDDVTSSAAAVSAAVGEAAPPASPEQGTHAEAAPVHSEDDHSENGSFPADDQAGLMTLLSASAQLLAKGGVGSVRLARAASRTLRERVDIPARGESRPGSAGDEEESLLARIFVSSETSRDAGRGDHTEERPLARLTVVEGPAANTSFEVRKVPAVLGGDDVCDIRLPGLASQQARLLHYSGQFVLHSLTEEPATCVQGVPISWALLKDGDSLELGPYRLRFNLPQ